jgi:hypothetical protein
MKTGDKVKIVEAVYTAFTVGSEHTISSINEDLIYIIDPFYVGSDEDLYAQWPFMEHELELVV